MPTDALPSLSVPYLDLARAAAEGKEALEAALLACVRRGRYVLGDEVAAFELQAAGLRVNLGRLAAGNARRRAIAARYDAALAPLLRTPPPVRAGEVPAHHLYVVRVDDRDAFRERIAAAGVGTDVHYPRAVHEQPAFAALPRGPLPETERAMREVVSLPLYPHLADDEVERVIEAVRASVRR